MQSQLTMGPILFNWKPDTWRDFYYRTADESPVDTVYIGEVVCSKRAPFFEPLYIDIAERLVSAGKKVLFSTLAEVMIKRERKMVEGMCELEEFMVEANDTTALYHLRGKPHAIGMFVNVYNEDTLEVLAKKGAKHITLPPELPEETLAVLGKKAAELDITLEVMVYGRIPLALSARCYHARAYGRIKDNCQFVCEEDSDGMDLMTVDGKNFLAVNGVQTLSYNFLNLINEMKKMTEMGVSAFRLSPHTHDMVQVASIFRSVLDKKESKEAATRKLAEIGGNKPFSNGFFYGQSGHKWVGNSAL